MSFVNLAFLWGLPLLAVPVAIHLLSRRRQEVVKWGAMQFLLDSSIRRRKIWRLDDLLLMLLRALAVLALVLALARPIWHGSTFGGGKRDIIFLWDVSLSMGRDVKNELPFERMVARTEELFRQIGPTDTLRGMVTIGRGEWLTSDPEPATDLRKEQLLSALKNTGVTEASADWLACFQSALRVAALPGSRARQIVVFSDGQAQGWRKEDQAGWQNLMATAEQAKTPTSIEIHNVVGSIDPPTNLAVDKLSTPRPLLGLGESFVVEAEIRNHGGTPVERATVEWSLDNVSLGRSTIGPVGPRQSVTTPLRHVAGKTGASRLTCRIETPDDLPGDNERGLVLEVVEHVPILLVDDSNETDPLKSERGYFLAAVGQDKSGATPSKRAGLFEVTTITSSELASQTLTSYRAIVIPNTPPLEEPAIARIADFVRRGGGLWLGLGDRTIPEEFNRQFYRAGSGLAPWPIEPAQGELERREKFVSIHPPLKGHPATTLLGDTQRLDIDRVKVFRRFVFTEAPASRQIPVLLETDAGEPLAIEGFSGRGRVIVLAIPMGVRWSNLPLMQAWVPLVHEWLWFQIQPTGVAYNLKPGEPLDITLPANDHVRELRLKQPGGIEAPLKLIHEADRAFAQSRRTLRPGPYEAIIEVEGQAVQTRPYQVARSEQESNLDPWPADLTARWNDSRVVRLDPAEPLVLPATTLGQATGEPIYGKLLVILLLALAAELWMVRRMAARRFGSGTPASGTFPGGAVRASPFAGRALAGVKGGDG